MFHAKLQGHMKNVSNVFTINGEGEDRAYIRGYLVLTNYLFHPLGA